VLLYSKKKSLKQKLISGGSAETKAKSDKIVERKSNDDMLEQKPSSSLAKKADDESVKSILDLFPHLETVYVKVYD
jgi:hypothetical protein